MIDILSDCMVSEFSLYVSVIPNIWSKCKILFYKLTTDYQGSPGSMTVGKN